MSLSMVFAMFTMSRLFALIYIDLNQTNKANDKSCNDPRDHGWLENPFTAISAFMANITTFGIGSPTVFTVPGINPFHINMIRYSALQQLGA